ncbi:MAG: hypothetical protein LAO30_04985 [Acidobacteriia bacterium]|nr:hypothetical protein [Terriglobia bacterium]
MAQDSLIYHAKALAMRSMIELLSDNSHQRELDIQTVKLARMAEEFDRNFPWHMVLAMPSAKLRKKKGPHLRRLAQQGKHLDKLLGEAIAEFTEQRSPMIRKVGKAKRNKFCQDTVEYFNSNVHKATEQLKLRAMQNARGELKS